MKFGREKSPNPNNRRDLGLGATRGPARTDPPQDPRALGVKAKVGGWVFPDKPGIE